MSVSCRMYVLLSENFFFISFNLAVEQCGSICDMTAFTLYVILFVIFSLIAHKLSRKSQNIFRDRGIEYEKPAIFFFGNMLDVFLGKISEESLFECLYEKFSREK